MCRHIAEVIVRMHWKSQSFGYHRYWLAAVRMLIDAAPAVFTVSLTEDMRLRAFSRSISVAWTSSSQPETNTHLNYCCSIVRIYMFELHILSLGMIWPTFFINQDPKQDHLVIYKKDVELCHQYRTHRSVDDN